MRQPRGMQSHSADGRQVQIEIGLPVTRFLLFRLPVHSLPLGAFQLEQEPENVCTIFVGEIYELNTGERPIHPSDDWLDLVHSIPWKYKN